MKLAHAVAEVLQQPVAQAHHLAQFVEAFLGHLAGRRMFLSREARDAERIDRIGLGAFQFFLGEASGTQRVEQRHRKTLGHQISKQIAPVVSRCFHGDQTALRRAEQLNQPPIPGGFLAKRRGLNHHRAMLVHHRHHVTLRADVDTRKPLHPFTSHRSFRGPRSRCSYSCLSVRESNLVPGYRASPRTPDEGANLVTRGIILNPRYGDPPPELPVSLPTFSQCTSHNPSMKSNTATRLGLGFEAGAVEQFTFERGKETLAHRVIEAIAHRAHRWPYAGLVAAFAKSERGVLAAMVGMVNHAPGAALPKRHV